VTSSRWPKANRDFTADTLRARDAGASPARVVIQAWTSATASVRSGLATNVEKAVASAR
jgi:hypothetical protein